MRFCPVRSFRFTRFAILSCFTLITVLKAPASSTKVLPKHGIPASSKAPSLNEAPPKETDSETIVILGTNDLHGAIFPLVDRSRASLDEPSVPYKRAGMATLGGYVQTLRKEFGDRFLWLDAGDEFQGTYESNIEQGATLVKILNQLGLGAAALGNHEFDFGQEALALRMKEARYPYLSANTALKGKNPKSKETSPLFPYLLKHTLLRSGSLQVGVLGLTTVETPTTTNPDAVKDLIFQELKQVTEEQAAQLRTKGAHLVVLVAHVGLSCSTPKQAKGLKLRAPEDLQGNCNEEGEMVKLLAGLKPGTLDAVVSGHTHQVVHHFLSQGGQPIPVIQGGHEGQYINIIYLTYDRLQKRPIPELSRIEGPIPVCEKVFEKTQDCNGATAPPKGGRGPLSPVYFHGQTLTPSPEILAMLAPLEKRLAPTLNQVLGTAARTIEKDRGVESPLGNLVTDAMRKAGHADVALTNPGGLRAPLYEGPITFGQVYRALPFDNKLCVVKILGAKLTEIIRASQQQGRRPFAISGALIKMDRSKEAKKGSSAEVKLPESTEDEEETPPIASFEVSLESGAPIDPALSYRLAVADFIVKGGSSIGGLVKQVSPSQVECNPSLTIRDLVIQHIQAESKRLGSLNSQEHPLVDFKKRRIQIIKTQSNSLLPVKPLR